MERFNELQRIGGGKTFRRKFYHHLLLRKAIVIRNPMGVDARRKVYIQGVRRGAKFRSKDNLPIV